MFFVYTDENPYNTFRVCFSYFPSHTNNLIIHTITSNPLPSFAFLVARMNINCSFACCIWMPPSLKPFKRAAYLGNCSSTIKSLRCANMSAQLLLPKISRTDRSTVNTISSVMHNLLQPNNCQTPQVLLSPLPGPLSLRIPGKFSPYLKSNEEW